MAATHVFVNCKVFILFSEFPADYSGSLEAILDILNTFKSDRIELEVASSGCGQISESDINLADAVDGLSFFYYFFFSVIRPLHFFLIQALLDKLTFTELQTEHSLLNFTGIYMYIRYFVASDLCFFSINGIHCSSP